MVVTVPSIRFNLNHKNHKNTPMLIVPDEGLMPKHIRVLVFKVLNEHTLTINALGLGVCCGFYVYTYSYPKSSLNLNHSHHFETGHCRFSLHPLVLTDTNLRASVHTNLSENKTVCGMR